jgi:hypothetical protein
VIHQEEISVCLSFEEVLNLFSVCFASGESARLIEQSNSFSEAAVFQPYRNGIEQETLSNHSQSQAVVNATVDFSWKSETM